jgi:hypothetical protein
MNERNRHHSINLPDLGLANHYIETANAIIKILDDLDIRGCIFCENLRYALIAWLQGHSGNYQIQKRTYETLIEQPFNRRKRNARLIAVDIEQATLLSPQEIL